MVLVALLSGILGARVRHPAGQPCRNPSQRSRRQEGQDRGTPQSSIPADVELQRDVTYGKGGEVALQDGHLPPQAVAQRAVSLVIVYIHGGGWRAGSKDKSADQLVPFVQRGYCGVSINYRLTPAVQFPEPLHDCKCAIRFLRAKAKELHLDPDHIGVWGHSSGGHLVALLGTTAHMKEFEGAGGWQDFSSRVQVVCAQGGRDRVSRCWRRP